ncbi:MAG: nucleotidyltransferase domain-containing protein [Tannerellaceae bacterium]|nr:nucleotidyltransferase domain-containing protein [Tannerellaceae bacterium]
MNEAEAEVKVLEQIKEVIGRHAPEATAILYGSRARGDARPDSDWDILLLLDKERITHEDRMRVADPLYDLGFDISELISVKVYTAADWKRLHFSIFHKYIDEDGITLQKGKELQYDTVE